MKTTQGIQEIDRQRAYSMASIKKVGLVYATGRKKFVR